jgi:TP901 family phage tail tape measure protein
MSGVARDILKIGAAAQASSARAQAAALRQQAANVRAAATARIEALKAAEAAERETAARMRAAGATRDQIAAVDAQARAYARDAAVIRAESEKQVSVLQKQAKVYDEQAKSLEADVRGHQRLAKTLGDVSKAASFVGIALVGVGAVGAAALLSTVKAAVDYDRQVALTKTQTDGFAASLKDLGQIAKDVGSKIAAPFNELQAGLYDIFSSTNANMKQAKVLLEAFAKAAVAGQVSIEDAGRSTMGIMNAFKIPFQQVNVVLDKQFQLVRKGVGTYGQFANVIGKLTPSAVRLGQNLDTMDAILIFLTRNGLSAASAVAAGARAMDALANPSTVGKLEKLKIAVRNAHGQFLPMVDILKNMKKYLLELPPPKRAQALFDIFKGSGGTIQAKRFFDLVLPTAKGAGNLDQFEGFLKDMKDSTGEFGKAYGTMANTVAAKSQLLKNNWDIMKVTIGQALEPAFKKLLDIGNEIVGWFNRLSPAQQKSLAKWALVAAAIMTVVGVFVLIIAGLGMLAAALAALGLSLGAVTLIVGGLGAAFVALGVALYEAYKGSLPVRQLFEDIGKTFTDIWNKDIWPFISGMRDGFNRDLLPALMALWDVISNRVVPVLDDLWNRFGAQATKTLGETLRMLQDVGTKGFQWVSSMINKFLIPAIKQATDFYNQHKSAIDKVLWVLGQLAKWIAIVAGSGVILGLVAAIAVVIAIIYVWVKSVIYIYNTIASLVNGIKSAISWIGHLGVEIGHAARDFAAAVAGGFIKFVTYLKNLPSTISHAVGSLGGVLVQAGRNVINGLINGISSRVGDLKGYLGQIGGWIASWKGPPAYDLKILHGAGQLIVKGLQNGIASAVPALKSQLKGVTGQMRAEVNANVSGNQAPVVPVTQKGSRKSFTINVYTQEIRPEYHSQQLGQLMAGTM